jgi:acetyl esterase/lipase
MMPKHSIGAAIDDCYDGYRWLRGRGYGPDRIVLAGDPPGGYLSLALAERLLNEGEQPAAIVAMSPLLQLAKAAKQAHPNIRTDAMFSAKAFDVFVGLIARRPSVTSWTDILRRSTSRSTTSRPVCPAR